MYMYIDGKYTRVTTPTEYDDWEKEIGWMRHWGGSGSNIFYRDVDGNLIRRVHGIIWHIGYNYVTLSGKTAVLGDYISEQFVGEDGNVIAWDIEGVPVPQPHYIPDTDIWVTPIQPYTDLQEQITERLTAKTKWQSPPDESDPEFR
ncbi:MAG: hypothetical protein FWG45_06390 [Oscillospiraceae bacterium]|nr:hypothetical protein [Oscillospiraceae bacterium]